MVIKDQCTIFVGNMNINNNYTWENCLNKHIASFVSTKENFYNSARGVNWLKKQQYVSKNDNYICNGEYIYEDIKEVKKFKDKKILIVGGGPTAKEYNWDASDYDYIFSLHNFYQSDKLKKININLFLVGNQTDALGSEFLNYCKNTNSIIVMEDLEHKPKVVKTLQEKFFDRILLCSCRAQFKSLGAAPKLVILALSFGSKQVDCVGIDGVPKNFNMKKTPYLHAFDNTGWDKPYPHEAFVNHFRHFDSYIKETFPNQIVNNLGAGHEFNCWSKI